MSESEKIREVPRPPPPQEQERQPQKTSPSAFDKVLEQNKIMQQSPVIQGKLLDHGSAEQRVREVTKWQDRGEEKKRDDDRSEKQGVEKSRQKEKGSETVTRQAVGRVGDGKGFKGSSGHSGRDSGGYASGGKRKMENISRRLSDAKAILSALNKEAFAGKLAQMKASSLKLSPQQMQAMVNNIVAAVRIGKNELGWPELKIILREHIFSGLRLRFTAKHGKVSIQFETQDAKVRGLFTAEAAKIKAALEEKGIAVSEIKVS